MVNLCYFIYYIEENKKSNCNIGIKHIE